MLEWSPEKISHVRRDAQLPEAFASSISKCKLAVLEGNTQLANQILNEILVRHGRAPTERKYAEHIFITSIIARRLDVAAQIAWQHFAAGWNAKLTLAPRANGWGGVVRWSISADRRMEFVINEDVFFNDQTEFFLARLSQTLPLFGAYSRQSVVQEGSVIVNMDDHGGPPGLAFCESRPEYFLVPDNSFILWRAYKEFGDEYKMDDVPWEQRRPSALWRGSTTGPTREPALGWRSLQRIQLCELAREHGDLFDVGISAITQFSDPAVVEDMKNSGLLRAFVAPSQFNRFKYQIDIDGNTNSWPGLFMKLLTGSPVLKIASPFGYRQWYYDRLKPWSNYVPVSVEMSDLVDKVRWLQANDETARRIGERGRALADSLEYEAELDRSGRTVTAALRYFARLPEAELRFGAHESGNVYLRDGWAEPEVGGVSAQGYESGIELPPPIAAGNFVLSLELSPITFEGSCKQRVTLVANGDILSQSTLSSRDTIRCLLPRAVIAPEEPLRIRLLHPDARTAACAARPLDDKVISTALHSLSLMPAHIYSMLPLRSPVAFPSGSTPTLVKNPTYELSRADTLSPAAELGTLRTHHDTIVFLSEATGAVRHGKQGLVPTNVFLAMSSTRCSLLYVALDGGRFWIGAIPTIDDATATGDLPPPATSFQLIPASDLGFGLRAHDLFLCAEGDGSVTLSRAHFGQWERFELVTEPMSDSKSSPVN